MEYNVGQILYFVGAESARVIPVRVVEEVVRTTIDGKEKTYTVELPDEKSTRVSMSKMKGMPFSTVNDVHDHMIKNARQAIDNMISDATTLTREVFNVEVNTQQEQQLELQEDEKNNEEKVVNNENISDSIVSVDIGNGVMAKMNMGDLNKVAT